MAELARRKYLERYAEPEARFALQLHNRYHAALILPAHREEPSFLDGVAAAAAAAAGRVLVIAVVNAAEDAPESSHTSNALLLEALGQRLVPQQRLSPVEGSGARALLGRERDFDLVVLDRATPGRRLPVGEGVGLARRIAMDLALGLHQRGSIALPWLGSTDADAVLPQDYFATLSQVSLLAEDGTRRVAVTLPFWHVPGADAAVDAATVLYEMSLRYYTLGLAAAGSAYAYESLGSALAVHADAYAEVRGFPRRAAGEDFYLLDKLAKLGHVHRPAADPIQITSRASDRVPFGTGPGVRQITERGQQLEVYHPRTFELLGVALRALRSAVRSKGDEGILPELTRVLGDVGTAAAISTALEELQAFEALREMLGASPDPRVRERRLLTWFDALRTLRFIHLIEVPAALPRLPLLAALTQAPFCRFLGPSPQINSARSALFRAECALPKDIGVSSVL